MVVENKVVLVTSSFPSQQLVLGFPARGTEGSPRSLFLSQLFYTCAHSGRKCVRVAERRRGGRAERAMSARETASVCRKLPVLPERE